MKKYFKRIIRTKNKPVTEEKPGTCSLFDEEKVIKKYIKAIPSIEKYCVDIGASDGVSMSNSYRLFTSGWSGLALECVPEKFTELSKNLEPYKAALSNSMVNPGNVLKLLSAYDVPKNFGLLTLDIDGYDYFVLKELLGKYSPTIICAEINEKIPPPIKFTVKYDKNYFWDVSHFYGQSISQLDELCRKHGYVLASVHYNNAFYIKKSKYKKPGHTAAEAYNKGYKNRPDRKMKFPWNEDFEEVFNLSPDDQIKYINNKFNQHKGKYLISKS